MRRFLCKCLLLTLIVSGVLVAAGQAYKQTTTYRNLEITEETEKYQHLPETLQFAVFGTSHGRDAFPFCLEEDGAFNFSMSSQTPAYDWRIMREFQDRFQPETIVILCVDYFSPYFMETPEQFELKQERYYRILSPKNIIDVNLSHWVLQKISPVLTTSVQSVGAAFLNPVALQESNSELQVSISELESEKARIVRDHWELIEGIFPEVNSDMWDAYHEMLALCQEKGWRAVLVTPPVLADYNTCFPDGFYEEFCRRIETLCTDYDISWMDYSHDSTFSEAYEYFKNIDHLNTMGAKVFGQIFRGDLEALGMIAK